jgi:hypothetical protein
MAHPHVPICSGPETAYGRAFWSDFRRNHYAGLPLMRCVVGWVGPLCVLLLVRRSVGSFWKEV